MEQRFTFDRVADLYDRHRPRYPRALFEALSAIAPTNAGDRALEIGCGTGQATLPLVEHGLAVTALEPGAALAALARRRLAESASAEVLESTFEAWPLEREAFALVFSAQAIHWVDPSVAFEKSADALAAGGTLAIVGNVEVELDGPVHDAIREVHEAFAPSLGGPPVTRWYAEDGPLRGWFGRSRRFGPLRHESFRWRHTYEASAYGDLLRTHSSYGMLGAEACDRLLREIVRAIVSNGGTVPVGYEAHLWTAQRR